MRRFIIGLISLLSIHNVWADGYNENNINAHIYDDVCIDLVLQLGNTVTLNPLEDLGVGTNDGVGGCKSTSYSVSDQLVFEVNVSKRKWYDKYDLYTIKALKTGLYTFYGKVTYLGAQLTVGGYKISMDGTSTATYRIHVIDVTSISIPSSLSLNVGETYKFYPSITDSRAITALDWKSDNNSVVKVHDGIITALSAGVARVSCTASNGVSASCIITVSNVAVQTIILPSTSIELTVGGKTNLTPTILPNNATNQKLTWSTSNSNVVSVTNGLTIRPTSVTPIVIIEGDDTPETYASASLATIYAVGEGTAIVTGYANDGSGATVSCTVTVKKPESESKTLINQITFTENAYQCLTVGLAHKLTAIVYPDDATDKSLTWSSDDISIVKISQDGWINTVGLGTTTVRCTANDGSGVTATCVIDVVATKVNEISLSHSTCELEPGQTQQFVATILPMDATDMSVSWYSTETSIARVDDTGIVTAIAPGVAAIICKALDGSNVQDQCIITVTPKKVSSISLNTNDITIDDTNEFQLMANVIPSDAANKDLSWTSSDANVANVDDTGHVTAQGKGTATITCRTLDGSGLNTSCKVTVNAVYIQSLEMNHTDYELKVGESFQLNSIINPVTTTYHSITWMSSNLSVAQVDENGFVTSVGAGTAIITCKLNMAEPLYFADPYEKIATCRVTVNTVQDTIPEYFVSNGLRYHFLSADGLTVEVTNSEDENKYAGEIVIPATVEQDGKTLTVVQIGERAFDGCKDVTSITMPNTINTIDSYAFYGCQGITSLTIPQGVEKICNSAFDGCSNMASISLPNTLKFIQACAFLRCFSLQSLTIPSSVTEIGSPIGGNYYDITTMSVEAGNPVYDSRDNCNAIIETATNRLVAGCSATTIPSSVTTIGEWAFNCSLMFELTIPEGVTKIEDRAFMGCQFKSVILPSTLTEMTNSFLDCSYLTEVVCHIATPMELNDMTYNEDLTFKSIGNPAILYVPKGSKSIYEQTIGWDKFAEIIELETDSFEPYFFADGIRYHVTSLDEQTVEVTDKRAFNRPSNNERYFYTATEIIIPATVENSGRTYSVIGIGERAFQECTSTNIHLPEGISYIKDYAFILSKTIQTINIPASITSLGNNGSFGIRGRNVTITSYLREPLEIENSVFGAYLSSWTLQVPAGTKKLYDAANVWKDFGSIVEMGSERPDVDYPWLDGAELVDGGVYYIRNVKTGQFLTGANAWATQISLSNDMLPYMKVKVNPITTTMNEGEDEVSGYELVLAEDGMFTGQSGVMGQFFYATGEYSRATSAGHQLFRQSDIGFIDRNKQTSGWVWNLTKTGYYYHIQIADGDRSYPNAAEEYMQGVIYGEPVNFSAKAEDEGIDWVLIPVESVDMDDFTSAVNEYNATHQYSLDPELHFAQSVVTIALDEDTDCLQVLQSGDGEITYYTSDRNSNVITIDKSGMPRINEVGTITLYATSATTERYKRAYAKCVITVADQTGVDGLEYTHQLDSTAYDLQGRKVQTRKLRSGIYINKNGKKFIAK